MIDLKNNEKLYLIINEGCDDDTHGLAIISDEVFPKFKEIIENLNKNSTYACMPKIHVYRVTEDKFREWSEEAHDAAYEKLYLNGKVYAPVEFMSEVSRKGERVI